MEAVVSVTLRSACFRIPLPSSAKFSASSAVVPNDRKETAEWKPRTSQRTQRRTQIGPHSPLGCLIILSCRNLRSESKVEHPSRYFMPSDQFFSLPIEQQVGQFF